MIKVEAIKQYLISEFKGLRPKNSWGETSFFYNPDGSSPHGAYFLTIKEKNGDNDKASRLDRENTYRINFGLSKDSFLSLFSEVPARPAKGGIISGDYNFTSTNQLTPHPIYGWMRWVAILNPNEKSFEKLKPLIEESFNLAVTRFNKRKR